MDTNTPRISVDGVAARVIIVPPIAGTSERALDFEVATTPRHSTGATITQRAARRLVREFTLALEVIEKTGSDVVDSPGETRIDPADYATRFSFPVKDSPVAEVVTAEVTFSGAQWAVRRKDNRFTDEVFSVDGGWVSSIAVNPGNAADVARFAYEKNQAIAVAHRLANP